MSPMPGGTGLVEGADHGTITGYTTHGCRCEECRAEKARYSRERRAAIKAQNPKAAANPAQWPTAQEFRAGMAMWDAGYERGRRDALALARAVVSGGAGQSASLAILRDLATEQREDAS